MADASIGGGGPRAFHVANIAYHAIATILLFLLLVRLTGCDGRSAVAALVFAIHPLRVESVVWIAERKDVLSLALGFAALYAWVCWVEKPSRIRYSAALGLFAAGLLAKPMLVTLPVVMLLLDRWPLGRFDLARGIKEKLPFFALAAGSAVVTVVAQARGGAVLSLTIIPWPTRLANACVVSVDYLLMTVWPRALALPYPYEFARLTPARVSACALVIVVLTALSALAWKTRPRWAVAWGWYLVTLLPVIGIVQVGSQAMADRYTYLPLVGPVIAVVWELADRLSRPLSIALAAVVVALLAFATTTQAALWRDSTTLLTHTIAVTGPNEAAHYALGLALDRVGHADQAIAEQRKALAISGGYADAWAALGVALFNSGPSGEGFEEYRQVVRERARDQAVRDKLVTGFVAEGTRRMRSGDASGAARLLREAVELAPEDASAHSTLGVVLARAGRLDDAERELAEAVRLAPGNAGYAANLERVRRMRGAP
jgi:Flp pilus assembly protein TadD